MITKYRTTGTTTHNQKFQLSNSQSALRCSEVLLDRGVTERILSWNERPWDIMKHLGKDSIRQMELMRFYMQHKQDPHGPNIALFVGNLPTGLSQRNYEQILNKYVTDENKFISIGPIYYEYGSVVLTFEDAQKAVREDTLELTVEDSYQFCIFPIRFALSTTYVKRSLRTKSYWSCYCQILNPAWYPPMSGHCWSL